MNGLNLYTWTWKKEAENVCDAKTTFGVMADEVERIKPHAVTIGADGYKRVNYAVAFSY